MFVCRWRVYAEASRCVRNRGSTAGRLFFAKIEPFSGAFQTKMVQTNGTSLYVRFGGQGPAVVLLHGFGDTGDMWAPLAAVLVKDHTVIVPDLRGMACPRIRMGGTPRRNQALDIIGVMDTLKVERGGASHARYR